MNDRIVVKKIYKRLYAHFGKQHWWPAESPFEVIIGAVLTQSTNWTNVEKALANLKRRRLLNPKKIYSVKDSTLAKLIKPSGYYNIKAKRIKNFINFLFGKYKGSLDLMFDKSTEELRKELLGINGIGPETADSILLYAAQRLVFVVDAYTKRIFARHNLIDKNYNYDMIQRYITENFPKDAKLYNEYHALIVMLGKHICKARPNCNICPINKIGK